MLREWWTRVRALRRGEAIHGEIAEEREFHIAMAAEEMVKRGMSETSAWEAARRKFGAPLRMQEAGYEARGGEAMEDIASDLRLALRLLRKTPVKTGTLIATVALGIGINTAVFSVIQAVVFQPLPFVSAHELVTIHQLRNGESEGVSYPNFEDWRAAGRCFAGMSAYGSTSATLTASDGARRVFGATVSANLFQLLGVTPLRGRLFREGEDAPGSERVAIVSDRLWHEVFHGCEEALGRTVTLDGVAYRVIGVVAGKLAFPVRSDELSYWTTVAVDAEPSVWGGSVRKSRGYPRYDAALARLKSGVTMAQARAEMTAIAGNVARLHPGMDLKDGVQLSAALEDVVGKTKPLLWKLYGAVFCVLLVACANAATLLLVGAVARCREFALRAALGAGRSRLVRQLLAESMVIALGGGVGGAALAWGLVSAFARIAPPDTPRLNMVHADGATLLYALALSVATGLVFGMAPAWAALRRDLADTLKEGARTFGRGRSGLSPGTVLIVGQIALSMTLGCSAAALTGGFWRILHTPRGFDPQDVLTASISLPPTRYPQGSAKVLEFYTELVDRMRRVHGVVGVSVAQSLPLSGQNNSTKVEVAGGPETNGASTDLRFVDTSYFQTLRIPLLQGRNLDAGDVPGRAAVVVVNRAFAARFLGWRNAVGARLTLGWGGNAPKEVVGVVGDIRHNALSAEAAPEVYVPLAQFPINDLALVMRTRASAGGVAATLREYVRRLDAGVPVEDVRTLEEYLLRSAATQRLLMWLLVAFAGSALLLAAIGLYGALGYSTACRQHEFGVRMALGSNGWGVMRLVLREGLSIALVGMLGGLALTEWLNGIGPLDGLSLTCSGTVLLGVAAVACWVPARRATRVDPLRSLRGE